MRFNHIFTLIILVTFVGVIISCSEKKAEETASEMKKEPVKMIELTQKQLDVNNIKMGTVTIEEFENIIDCNGYIEASPNGMALVSAQLGGIVKKINVAAGDHVIKGKVLVELASNDFINMQKDFLETSAKLTQLESDYKRSKALYEQKIGSEKNYIAAKSAYKSMQAKYNALKMQLKLLDLNVNDIENGKFYMSYPLVAPISGIVSDVYINLGQYVEPQQKFMEIVDDNLLQLKLSVFEEDINYLKPGQTVEFYTINNRDSIYHAELNNISKSINEKTKTITCLANIRHMNSDFINNSFIRANIITDKQKAHALPNSALIKSGTGYYVLQLAKKEGDQYYFKKVKVLIGRKSKKFTEILNYKDLDKVLVDGIYNLNVN
jgi:cobalt-zinc-cadmium efflux system membrane fusion protein